MGQNEYGVWLPIETKRQVFCQVDSITQSEYFEAGRNGLNPAYRFRIFMGDYADEETIEYKGQRYAVYRTYLRRDDNIELYVERKGGVNAEIEADTATDTDTDTDADIDGDLDGE